MKTYLKVIIFIVLCIALGLVAKCITSEPFKKKRRRDLSWRLSGSAVFSRGGIHRKVNVPLTPLKSPLQKAILPKDVELPPFLMYKSEYLSKSGDQGDLCGSCWAFSLCNMISDRISINTLGKFNENLSVQHLLQCFEPEEACNGNSPESALDYLVKNDISIPLARDEPYLQLSSESVPEKCSTLSKKGATVKNVRSLTKFIKEEGYSDDILKDNITNMKKELLTNGPFYAAMTVYDDFFDYDGLSVYSHDKEASLAGGHAIEIIGWCDEGIDKRTDVIEDIDKGYWVCRNSWSESWPSKTSNKGYFLIRMGVNESGIESRCGSADPDMIMRGFEEERFMMWLDIDNFLDADPRRKREGVYI